MHTKIFWTAQPRMCRLASFDGFTIIGWPSRRMAGHQQVVG